jgi:predicted  nucleic acid-binding Zn-ribbon protein
MRTASEPRVMWVILIAILCGGIGGRVLSASPQATSPDMLGALLSEVKGLRAALEQMSSASARIQLSVARLQIEEQRINDAGKRLLDLRRRLGDARRELQENESRIADLEKGLAGNPQEDARTMMNQELVQLRRAVGPGGASVAELSSQEAELTAEIATEQSRWIELSRRLDELDASMATRK